MVTMRLLYILRDSRRLYPFGIVVVCIHLV